jgi:hypothetical protein
LKLEAFLPPYFKKCAKWKRVRFPENTYYVQVCDKGGVKYEIPKTKTYFPFSGKSWK